MQLQLPLGTDPVAELRLSITNIANTLDNAATVTSGTLASIPAPSLAGRRYFATDAGIELWDTGTAWQPTGPALPVGAMAAWSIGSDPVDADGVTRWMVADGRAVSKATYVTLNTLYNSAGYPYGSSGGNLNLPDTRGRVLVSPDTGIGTGAAGRVTANNTLAATDGVNAYTLLAAESGTNGSGATGTESANHQHGPGSGTFFVDAVNLANQSNVATGGGATNMPSSSAFSAAGATASQNANHTHGLVARNADSAHTNMQPYIAVHHIIRVL